jgi:hypothetical protein
VAAEAKYEMTVHPTAGLVRSQSDGARAHQVTLPSCDCADYINRKGNLVEVDGMPAITLCKHIVEFLQRVGGWNRQPEPVPVRAVIYANLFLDDVKKMLQDVCVVGFGAHEANQVLAEVHSRNVAEFSQAAGAPVNGKVEYDKTECTYTLTISR